MLKKVFLFCLLVVSAVSTYAQNEVGAYIFPQYTAILNGGYAGEDQYKNVMSFSKGVGVNFIHFFKGKKDNRKHTRYAYRGDLMYSGHTQAWEFEYRKGHGQTGVWEGKKRLDYIKLAPSFEISIPRSKHLSIIAFAGPQLSFLIDQDGGILTWEDRGDYDYFDLPEKSRDYYKPVTLDIAAGVGVDYEYTKWINISVALRSDFSVTNVENSNKVVDGQKSYNVDTKVGSSHNLTVALLLGVEYTLHKPQYAKTRF